jgi:hypothetical protein
MVDSTDRPGVYPTDVDGPVGDRGNLLGVLELQGPATMRGIRLSLLGPEVILGRDSDVRLDSPTVSRRHTRLWAAGEQVLIQDAGSANGTIVNGRRVDVDSKQPLADGDRIRLGDVEAIYHSGSLPKPRTPRPQPQPIRSSEARTTVRVPPATTGTETTRHLCAAAHLDPRYREQVLDATVRETYRAVAPSPGVDLPIVARHAVVAERRALKRDGALAAILAAAVGVALVAARSMDLIELAERRDWGELAADGVGLLLVGLVLLLAAWGVVVAETWVRLSTLARYVRRGRRPETLPQPTGARTARALEEIARVSAGNVVVYSVYEPFVGSGLPIDATSYPVPLLPANDGGTGPKPVPFSAGELVTALTTGLRKLELESVRVDRRLYVDGFDVVRFPTLLADPKRRPTSWAPAPLLEELTEQPSGNVRPYLCVEVTGWQGQMVVTTFVRVVVLTGILFVETAAYVLPPLRREYSAVDAMRIRTTSKRVGRTLREATAHTVPALLASPVRLGGAVAARRRAAGRARECNRMVDDRVKIDRGATTSLRQEASGTAFSSYFMQLDAAMAFSVVRERVADVVADFLATHGYRTDKITLIQNSITNDNSFKVGSINGSVGAVGPQARGTISGAAPGREGRQE